MISSCLVIHNADPHRWAERYDLEIVTRPCGRCGAPLTTTIPFAAGEMRGLSAPPCACGGNVNEGMSICAPYCVVHQDPGGDVLAAMASHGRKRR